MVVDFALEIKMLSKGLDKAPPLFRAPLFVSSTQGQSKEKTQAQLFYWADMAFSSGKAIGLLFFTQKKALVSYLRWASECLQNSNTPLACFSLRAFLEVVAHLSEISIDINEEHTHYCEKIKSGSLSIGTFHDAYSYERQDYVKEKFYNKIMAAAFANSLDFGETEWPNSADGQTQFINELFDESEGDFRDFQTRDNKLSELRFSDNQTINAPKDGLLSPKRIMGKLQKLEKHVDRLRPTYEFLSEFIHPNSYASTAFVDTLFDDEHGEVYWNMLQKPKDIPLIFEVLEKNRDVFSECVKHVLQLENDLKIVRKRLDLDAKKTVRATLKNIELLQRHLNDSCICESGKPLRSCCAKTNVN